MSNEIPQAQPAQSFTERKAAQLREERSAMGEVVGDPITPEAPATGTPSGEMESAEVVEQDEPQGLYADEGTYQDDLEGSDEALEDEIPSSEDQALEGDNVDWEKRYNDLRSETQQILEGRGKMEEEQAVAMQEHLRLKFEMEDRLTEAAQRAEFMRTVMTNNVQQYQNIDWSQVPPDKVQEVQAQAQQAFAMAQQAEQGYNQMVQAVQHQKEQTKQREAAIAKTRLRRTIPDWGNETYGQLREFAASKGMPAESFNDITDPVIIEAMHAYRQLAEGASTVQNVRTNRKSAAPRGKAARRQPRDERGKFATKQVRPNERGSFADKHQHRLAMERQGR